MTRTHPQTEPAGDFAEALERYEQRRAAEMADPDLDDGCASTLLHHGAATERALVLFHGYTNCPQQLSGIAELAYSAGLNVYSPLAPEHGRTDRDPSRLEHVTELDLERFVTEAVALASGLAEHVAVLGFSFGGVCASWAARHLDEVSEALILSPSFAPRATPLWAVPFLPVWSRMLPERQLWWDPVRKEGYLGAPYSYRRFSRRGIGTVFALGQDVTRGKARRSTRLQRAVLVLNATDVAISPTAAWQAFQGGVVPIAEDVELYRFKATDRFPHDLIDPNGMSGSRAPDVWPVLLSLLGVQTDGIERHANDM